MSCMEAHVVEGEAFRGVFFLRYDYCAACPSL
jgi:hypothetical protein